MLPLGRIFGGRYKNTRESTISSISFRIATLPFKRYLLAIVGLSFLLLTTMMKKYGKSTEQRELSSTSPPSTLTDGVLPKLIVFDLDYTLWPFWVDTHVTPPLKASATHDSAKDRFGESFAFYKDVPSILHDLRAYGVKVAAASRTSAPELGREMLRLLHIDTDGKRKKSIDFFDYMEIYPGSKITHFTKLQKATGLDYKDMLFFDDEARNKNVETLGVTMYLVRDGVTRDELDNGIREWRKKRGHNPGSTSTRRI